MIGIVLRILLPALAIYFFVRFVRELIQRNISGSKLDPRADPVIDVCPDCGRVVEKGHRCDH